jgi:hypothetical protein
VNIISASGFTAAVFGVKMSRKPNRKTLQHKLQAAVNLYARLRDCSGRGGAHCISCGQWKSFADGDGGHFVPSTSSATRYREENVNFQCVRCNRFLHGNGIHYYEAMVKKYGQATVDELLSLEHVIKKWSIEELQEKLAYFNAKISELS